MYPPHFHLLLHHLVDLRLVMDLLLLLHLRLVFQVNNLLLILRLGHKHLQYCCRENLVDRVRFEIRQNNQP